MLYKLLFLTLAIPWMGFAETKPDQNALRLENLLIWKLTDELELSAKEEIAFSKLIKDLGQQRRVLQMNHDEISLKLKSNAEPLAEYKKNLEKLSQNSLQEVTAVEELLGKEKAAKYVYLKSEILKRITAELSKRTEMKSELGKSPSPLKK